MNCVNIRMHGATIKIIISLFLYRISSLDLKLSDKENRANDSCIMYIHGTL